MNSGFKTQRKKENPFNGNMKGLQKVFTQTMLNAFLIISQKLESWANAVISIFIKRFNEPNLPLLLVQNYFI